MFRMKAQDTHARRKAVKLSNNLKFGSVLAMMIASASLVCAAGSKAADESADRPGYERLVNERLRVETRHRNRHHQLSRSSGPGGIPEATHKRAIETGTPVTAMNLRELVFERADDSASGPVTVQVGNRPVAARTVIAGPEWRITLDEPIQLKGGETLTVEIR